MRGEPTGKRTPATLAGLPVDEPLEVQVQLSGREPARERVTLKRGETAERTLRLDPTRP